MKQISLIAKYLSNEFLIIVNLSWSVPIKITEDCYVSFQ